MHQSLSLLSHLCRVVLSVVWLLLLSTQCLLHAASLPGGFAETLVANGLASPTAMAFAPDNRLFVCQQGGQLRVIKDGVLLPTPFLTVSVDSSGERGLLGLAFDPDFAANGYVYVYYTATTPTIHNRVSRFTASGDTAVPGSETIILELNDLSNAANHNGGAMHFGADGKLYIAVGENARASNSQTLSNLLGKMLRINRDGSIPSDNPFYITAAENNRAIWALGLRNPFTFAFQPGTSRMFINDVGLSTWEEINDGVAGANYGWPDSEGPTSNPEHRGPVYYYGRGAGVSTGCAITGGTFYNPPTPQFPGEYTGSYFFADFCSGWINRLDSANGNAVTVFATGLAAPVDLRVGSDGGLYYLQRGGSAGGAVYKVFYTLNQAPSITQQPSDQTVMAGQAATFSVAAAGPAPLTYQWQRNNSNIAGATSSSYTLPTVTAADTGAQFRCVVTNPYGTATSNPATLVVTSTAAASLQFSAPNFSAIESAGGIQITVIRSGDTSGAAVVSYTTDDSTAVLNCATDATGIASPRCDYATSLDTLSFAPGEVAKSFTIPIIDDAHAEGTETLTVSLRNSVGAILGAASTAQLAIVDNDAGQSPVNPIDISPLFVRQHYLDFLNREPEQAGLEAWLAVLNGCGGGGQGSNPACDRIEVSASFLRSNEFYFKGYFVYRFYKVSFDRLPKYTEIIPDMRRVSGATGDEVIAKREAFITEWVERPEFKAKYDGLSQAAYVDELLKIAAVGLASRDQLVSDLESGRKTRAEVLRALVESPEVFNKEYNGAFVAMQYFGYLRRDPEPEGYRAWMQVIERTPTDYRTMVHGFVTSVEYRNRFGQP